MKNNQSGFGVMAVILIFIVVGLIGVFGWMVWGRQKESAITPPVNKQSNCKTIKDERVCDADYIGLSETEAMNKVKDKGLIARVVERNGEAFTITLDYSEQRLNFTISKNKVTKVEFY